MLESSPNGCWFQHLFFCKIKAYEVRMLCNKSVQALKKGCDLICLLIIIYTPSSILKGNLLPNSYRKDNLLIYEVMLPVTEHTCPYCGYTTKYIKDYRVRTINLGSIHGLLFVLNTSNVDILALNALIRFQKKIPLFSVINN